jgi:hypothetical protein
MPPIGITQICQIESLVSSVEKWRMGRNPTSHTGDGFLARKISDVNEGVVEGGVDVGNAEDQLSLCDLGPERDRSFLWDPLDFWRLQRTLLECAVIG